MPRVASSLLLLLIPSTIVSAQSKPSNGLDVLYVWDNYQQLVTYDVNAEGQPTQVGQPLPFPDNISSLTTDHDGHSLYIVTGGVGQPSLISVYGTGENGAPRAKPKQQLSVRNYVEALDISPNPHFAYAIHVSTDRQGFAIYQMWLFQVDTRTGRLSETSKLEYSSGPNGPCGTAWSEVGNMSFDGFSADGSTLYTAWYCSSHGATYGYNYAFAIDPNSGQLGRPREVFQWASNEGGDYMAFTERAAIDIGNPGYGSGQGWVNVYPPGGGSQMIFSCTAQMLEGCGYGGVPDPIGEYIFLATPSYGTDVARIDIANKQIVDTGNTIPNEFVCLSPDRHMVYTQMQNTNPVALPIYTFNVQTGALQQGGTIDLSGQQYELFPALRR